MVTLFKDSSDIDVQLLYEVHDIKTKGFNTKYSELSPVIYNDQLVYTSDRDYHFHSTGEDAWSRTKFYNVFSLPLSELHDTIKMARPRLFAHELLTNDHVGPISFSKDGKEAYITMAPLKRKHSKQDHHLHIYKAVLENNKWTDFSQLFPQETVAYGHLSITEDGQRAFFSADLPGGYGGKDLYYIQRNDSTSFFANWSEPVNLGASVNTEKDELFPYSYKGELYFSSNGLDNGFGGLDLYKTKEKEEKWMQPENLGESINTTFDDFSLSYNNDKSVAYFSSNRNGSDDIFYADVVVQLKRKSISGVFQYRNLPGQFADSLKVYLVDDEGNIVYETFTDSEGKFSFENLPYDSQYTIKTHDSSDDVIVKILSENGDEFFLMSNNKGEFLYRKLEPEDVGSLSFMQVDDTTMKGTIYGQFIYDLLPSDNPEGLNVYLVDDEGNIVYQTVTDKFGNFKFENLPIDNNYMLKMDAEENVSVIIYNSDDQVIAELKNNTEGYFSYKLLSSVSSEGLSLLQEKDTDLILSNVVYGQFKKKDTTEVKEPLEFEIYTAGSKELIVKTATDLKGFFRLTNLPPDEDYLYKIITDHGEMEDFILILKDRNDQMIMQMVKGDDHFFYTTLDMDKNRIDSLSTEDAEMVNQDIQNAKVDSLETKEIKNSGLGDQLPKIYFDKNSSYLSQSMYPTIHKLIEILQNNPLTKIEITTHSDSRGDVGYNLWMTERRSQRIAQYLIDKGIAQDRIKTEALGESVLANSCYDETECTEEEHRMNRVVDFRIF